MFKDEEFIKYMYKKFPNVFQDIDKDYERDWLENLVQYATETFEDNYDRFEAFMISILPEVEEDDLIQFKIR